MHVVRMVSESGGGHNRPRRQIHKRDGHLRSVVVPRARRPPVRKPEGLLLVANRRVPVRIERARNHRFPALRIDAHDFIDREDFGRIRPAHIGHDRVFELPLIQQNRLGGLRETD